MAVSIVSNTSSLIARNSLTASNERLDKIMTRLSSGERVFNAEEDAAALGVGAGMKVELAALQSAAINTSTASSMLQVAEGALGQISELLQRMNSLASQASSGQYSDSERALMDTEFSALRDEVDRIASDTDFGGQKLLSGDALFTTDYAHAIQADGVSNPEFNSILIMSDATFRYTYDSATEELTMNRTEGAVTESQIIDLTALLDNVAGVGQNLSAGEELKVQFGGIGVSITLDDAFDRTSDILGTVTDNSGADISFTFPAAVAPTVVSEPVTFANTNVTNEAVTALQGLNGGGAYTAANGMATLAVQTDGANITLGGVSGLRYSVNGGAVGADGADSANLTTGSAGYFEIYVTTASGYEKLARIDYDDLTTSGTTDGTIQVPLGRGMFDANYTATGGDLDLEFMVGTSSNTNEDMLSVTLHPATASALGVTTLSLSTQTQAEITMDTLQIAMTSVNTMRSEIGASQSRLDFVSAKLGVDIENTTNAKSALLDTDVPAEIAKMATESALVEMGISMLTQVNQMPSKILRLLEG